MRQDAEGVAACIEDTTDVYSATGNLMWLVGSHNMKFGTEYRYYIEDASRSRRRGDEDPRLRVL